MAVDTSERVVTSTPSKERQVTIKSIHLNNLLSFGPETTPLDLLPLNILVGPNGSGKSNFLDAVGLLAAAAKGSMEQYINDRGGVVEWIWKNSNENPVASIQAVVPYTQGRAVVGNSELRYSLSFAERKPSRTIGVVNEYTENAAGVEGRKPVRYFDHSYESISYHQLGRRTQLFVDESYEGASALPYMRIAARAEINYIRARFQDIRLYVDWNFGRDSLVRKVQQNQLLTNTLLEDASNLAAVLNNLKNNPDSAVEARLIEYLKYFYRGADDVRVNILGDFIQLVLREKGFITPASRISEGTLHWLALLAVLLHPDPPAIICIEEPETNLHPNAIPLLANLLRQAARKSQIIVTTHSRPLVDQFTDTPESVIVCEKVDESTVMNRLSPERLSNWLEQYNLGEIWEMNVVGGNS